MTGNPVGTDVCHLRPLRPGDISVTNDLQRRTGQDHYGPDLHFQVELRGFEPLTPSMRSMETPSGAVARRRVTAASGEVPSWSVAAWLALPGVVVTWLVTGFSGSLQERRSDMDIWFRT